MTHVLAGAGSLLSLLAAIWLGLHRTGAPKRPGYVTRNPDASRLGRWSEED